MCGESTIDAINGSIFRHPELGTSMLDIDDDKFQFVEKYIKNYQDLKDISKDPAGSNKTPGPA